MKKVLSLVLAFAMILGSFGFVFASNFPDVKDGEYFTEPVNVLAGLDVITGFPDGTFGPEKEVTRAQMATMIVNALGMSVTGQADTKFSDVPKAHWASGFINYAASVGFIAGFPDGTFKPDQQVTYDQALTMIVAAEGYKAESLTGTWPGNFVNQARALGILDICKTTGTSNAPRQDIACFLYKALTNKLGYTDKDGAFHPNLDANGRENDTMLARLGAGKYDPDGDGKKEAGDPFVVTGTEDSVINLQNYLGEYVTAYANKDGDIIAIAEELSTFIEGDCTDDDLYDTYSFSGKKVDYVSFTNGDLDVDSAGKSAPVDYDGKEGVKLAVKISGKTVKEVYSMQVWDPEDTFDAAEDIQDDIEDQKLDKYEFALDDNKEIDSDAYTIEGADAITDIKEGDIVTVYLHKSGANDGKIAKIEVSDEIVTGVITKVNKGETDSTKFTVSGTAYPILAAADGGQTDSKTLYGYMKDETEVKFYMTYSGKIYDVEPAEETVKKFAVVLATGKQDTALDGSTAYIRLLLADGTTKDYVAAKIEGITDGKTWSAAPDNGSLVSYSVNSKDKVSALEAATKSYKKEDAVEFDANGIFKGDALNSSTAIFSFAGGTADVQDADNYEVLTFDALKGAKAETVKYFVDKGAFDAVLVTGVSAEDAVLAIFAEKTGMDKDGEVWSVLYDSEVKTFTVDTTDAHPAYTTGAGVAYKLTLEDEVITGVKPGDKVKFAGASEISVAEKSSVSGNIYKNGTKSFSLVSDAPVYVYDKSDDAWTVKTKSALAGKANAFLSVELFDTDGDGVYDFGVIMQK